MAEDDLDDLDGSVRCYLCRNHIPDDEAEEFWCAGCEAYICEEHLDPPGMGPHEPEDHADV